RQEAELLTQEAERGNERIRGLGTGVPTEEALQDSRQRGEELVKRLTDGWKAWVAANGGDTWTAINTSIQKWLDEGGRTELVKKGNQIGAAIAEGIGAFLGEWVKQTFFPGGTPRVEGQFDPLASLPTVNVPVAAPDRPGATGGANITINVAELANQPGFQQRLQAAFEDFWRQFLQTEAATDPGASGRQQGAGRTP
ncbi:MAG TPA: hypothetical protein VH257_23040, partial [Chloroflexota bacterium]|nr:hypothetical protein [Chloroflexota bacterium]